MPDLSPCGRAVEWVRSAHKGKWRFIKGNPAAEVDGFYYFAPDAPFLPFPHLFGSHYWINADEETPTRLGNVRGKNQWYSGSPPLPLADIPPTIVGNPNEFAGAVSPASEPDRAFWGGFDSRCWTNLAPTPRPIDLGFWVPAYLLGLAQLLKYTHDENWQRLTNFFECFLPPGNKKFRTREGTWPTTAVGWNDFFTMVFLGGTGDLVTLALQGLWGSQSPVDQGPFGTSPLWWLASNRTMQDLATTPPTNEILLCGYSYGAAVASIVAGRLRVGNAMRKIHLLTFGLPKPGDEKLQEILGTVNRRDVLNERDFIGRLPPSFWEGLPLLFLKPQYTINLILNWAKWAGSPFYMIMDETGKSRFGQQLEGIGAEIEDIIFRFILGLPVAQIEEHMLEEYISRLVSLNGGYAPCYPLEPCWGTIFPPPIGPGAGGPELGGQLARAAGGGGPEIDGNGEGTAGDSWESSGVGSEVDGHVVVYQEGGVETAGQGEAFLGVWAMAGDGGLEIDGTGPGYPGFDFTADGGFEVDGNEASAWVGGTFGGDGGPEIDGDNETAWIGGTFAGNGGAETTGNGDSGEGIQYAGDGGVEIDGP